MVVREGGGGGALRGCRVCGGGCVWVGGGGAQDCRRNFFSVLCFPIMKI